MKLMKTNQIYNFGKFDLCIDAENIELMLLSESVLKKDWNNTFDERWNDV